MNTKASRTRLFVVRQTSEREIPKNAVWKEVRATGESASENIETVKSGEFSQTNAVTDLITVGADAENPFNINLTGDPTEREILEWGSNSYFDVDGWLKAGNKDIWLAVRRVLQNQDGSFITDTIGCVCSSMAFSITAKTLNSLNLTPNGLYQEIRDNYWFYKGSGAPIEIYGSKNSVWLDIVTGLLYQRTSEGWDTENPLNESYPFQIASLEGVDTVPTSSTGSEHWAVVCGGVSNGNFYYDDGVDVHSVFSLSHTQWLYGSGVPDDDTVAGEGYVYVNQDDSVCYQKVKKGADYVWVEIGQFNWTLNFDTVPFYYQNTYVEKSTNAIMKFAELRNVIFTNVLGTKCVDDLSFTIDNQVEAQDGMCTGNLIKDFPNYKAITIARGEREVKGNFTSYFYNNELSKLRHYGQHFYLEFIISNGIQGYRVILPRAIFDGGDPQATNASDVSVRENFTYVATVDSFYNSDIVFKYMDDVKKKGAGDSPRLYYGYVLNRDEITEANISNMTNVENLSGNIEVITSGDANLSFAVLSPVTEPPLKKFVNLETLEEYRADDEVNGIPIVENVARVEGTYLIEGVEYYANVMVRARQPRDIDGAPCYCMVSR